MLKKKKLAKYMIENLSEMFLIVIEKNSMKK